MAKLSDKLSKVNESISINRYDNGFMIDVGGRDNEGEWKSSKILCNTLDELLTLVTEYTTLELDN